MLRWFRLPLACVAAVALAATWPAPSPSVPLPPLPETSDRLPPLERLDRNQLGAEERLPWQPSELLAVLGDHRGRHWDAVACVAFSPDGNRVASAAGKTVYVWDTATLRLQALLQAHRDRVEALVFTPDGRGLASASSDGTVRLWDVGQAKPAERAVLRAPGGLWSPLAVSPDGRLLAACEGGRGVRLWDLAKHAPREWAALPADDTWPLGLAFSPDSRTLATVTGTRQFSGLPDAMSYPIDRKGKLWDVSGPAPREQSVLEGDPCGALAFSPDGKTLACDTPSGVCLWDLTGEKPQAREVVPLGSPAVQALSFSPDGKALLIGQEGKLRWWDLGGPRAKERAVLQLPHLPVRLMSLAPDGKTLAAASGEVLRLWDFTDGNLRERHLPRGHTGAITALSLGGDDRILATAGADYTLRLWHLRGSRPEEGAVLRDNGYRWDVLAVSPDGRKLAAGSVASERLRLWDVNGRPGLIAERKEAVCALAFSRDGRTLAATGAPFSGDRSQEPPDRWLGAVRLFDTARPQGAVKELGPSRSLENPRLVTRSLNHSLAFSPDGQTLAYSGDGKSVEVWDLVGGQLKKQMVFAGNADLRLVSFGPRGNTLAIGTGFTGGEGAAVSEVRLFDVTGSVEQELATFAWHGEVVSAVGLSADGKTLAAADREGRLVVWDVPSGTKFREWRFPGPINCLIVAPGGRHLLTGNADSTAYILRLPYRRGESGR